MLLPLTQRQNLPQIDRVSMLQTLLERRIRGSQSSRTSKVVIGAVPLSRERPASHNCAGETTARLCTVSFPVEFYQSVEKPVSRSRVSATSIIPFPFGSLSSCPVKMARASVASPPSKPRPKPKPMPKCGPSSDGPSPRHLDLLRSLFVVSPRAPGKACPSPASFEVSPDPL